MQFDAIKTKEFEPIPEGDYAVIIEDAKEGRTESEDPTDYIEMTLRLANNRIVWDRLWADNPIKATFVARAVGTEFDGELTPAMLKGKQVSIHLVIDDKGDKPRNKVTMYRGAEQAPVPF